MERIRVKRSPHRGADQRKLRQAQEHNRLAGRIEEYVNDYYVAMPPGVRALMAHSVAFELNENPEAVRRIMMSIQGGSNAITLWKRDATGNYPK